MGFAPRCLALGTEVEHCLCLQPHEVCPWGSTAGLAAAPTPSPPRAQARRGRRQAVTLATRPGRVSRRCRGEQAARLQSLAAGRRAARHSLLEKLGTTRLLCHAAPPLPRGHSVGACLDGRELLGPGDAPAGTRCNFKYQESVGLVCFH